MILPDHELRAWAKTNVTPYDPECINPASIDLRLGDEIRIPHRIWTSTGRELERLVEGATTNKWPRWAEPLTFTTYQLRPGDFVLCHSLECTRLLPTQVGCLYLKSSLGRMGLEHLHAGFGDPGFEGQWTWELKNMAPWPIELVAGQRLMQLVVMKLSSPPEREYGKTGKYQGQTGPTEAR